MVSLKGGGELMKTAKIEKTLKSIIEIDNQGKSKAADKEELHNIHKEKLTRKKREIEREYMKEARLETKKKREKIYNELEREVSTINSNTNNEIQRLNFLLENNIDIITNKIFNKILKKI